MVYAMEYSCGREGRKRYVTVCCRFGENFIGEFIGVNPYSAMDCKEVTMDAARSFKELGISGKRDMPEGTNKDGWPFPYLHNPFAITAYYMDEEVPPEPSEQRKTSDYEIKWKDKGMETIMRSLEELMMRGEAYPEIRDIRGFEGMNSFTSVMIILPSVKDISVFAELPRLETLWINCHKKVDITPVKEAGQIKSLMVNTEEIR